MMSSLTPVSAAEGLRRRDAGILAELVRQHHPRVLHYLLALTRSRDEAEDLSQETWLRVMKRGGQYRGDRPFESWLFTIARNLAVDSARRSAQWPTLPLKLDWHTPDSRSPYELALRAEMVCRLHRALRRLSPLLRDVWHLRVDCGLSLAAMAGRLAVQPGTVRSRLHRSVAALRRALVDGAEVSVHAARGRTKDRQVTNR